MKNFWTAPALAMIGGLLLLIAGAAGWVDVVESRDVGGVTVTEPGSVSGTVYAPAAVAIGLAGMAGGAMLAVLRGRARRVLGAVVAVTGVAGLAVVAAGIRSAAAVEGVMTPAPFAGLAAALGVTAGGIAAARGPARPPKASRYRVAEEQAGDDEWSLAAGDDAQD